MRRITLKHAKPGMVLGVPAHDNFGILLFEAHTKLDEDCLKILATNAVTEILLDDWRVADVVVEPLVSPELEGKAAQALRRLMIENQGKPSLAAGSVDKVVIVANSIARELEFESIGEAAIAGIMSEANYMYIQPVKTAVLSLLMGRRIGYSGADLGCLGAAALLKDVGYISIPQEILLKPELLTEKEFLKIRQHPSYGYELLSQHHSTSGTIANAVLQHHERGNGGGYPYGLKDKDINPFAQIIAIADT